MLDILPQQIFLDESHHQVGDDKINSHPHRNGNLYLCQPHTVIELVEVAPPPPRRITSVINSSSSYYSSSSSSSSFDEEDEDEEMDGDEEMEDEEEEEICSSYCSSDYSPEELETSKQQATALPAGLGDGSDSFARRMKRILSWREFSTESLSSEPSLKRKLEEIEESLADDSDDNASHCSKRSRSHGSSVSHSSSHSSITSEELNMHPCPACDAFFPTLQSLRAHGQRDAPHTSEACCVAVEYAFEQ